MFRAVNIPCECASFRFPQLQRRALRPQVAPFSFESGCSERRVKCWLRSVDAFTRCVHRLGSFPVTIRPRCIPSSSPLLSALLFARSFCLSLSPCHTHTHTDCSLTLSHTPGAPGCKQKDTHCSCTESLSAKGSVGRVTSARGGRWKHSTSLLVTVGQRGSTGQSNRWKCKIHL